MKFPIPDELMMYVNALADTGVFGTTASEVVEHLVREGIANQLRDGGLLHGLLEWQRAKVAS